MFSVNRQNMQSLCRVSGRINPVDHVNKGRSCVVFESSTGVQCVVYVESDTCLTTYERGTCGCAQGSATARSPTSDPVIYPNTV